jgi:pilus assembly protein Flp/PilA
MMTVKSLTALFWRRDNEVTAGATAIEYALIAAGIAVVIVGGVALVGGNLTNVFNSIGSAL